MIIRTAFVICCLVVASAATSALSETTLHFRAVERGTTDVGVPSHLYRRESGGASVQVSTDGTPSDIFVYTESNCQSTTQYTMRPRNDTEYTYSSKFWVGCEPNKEYVFPFTPKSTATNLATLLLSGSIAPLGQPTAPQSLVQSVEGGDYGTAAYLSTELSVALAGAGKPAEASQWSNAAVVAGWQAVATQVGTDLPAQPLTVIDGGVVLSEQALEVVKLYQKSIGIKPDGKLNWQTLKSLSTLANTDIEALRVQKLETLGSLAAE